MANTSSTQTPQTAIGPATAQIIHRHQRPSLRRKSLATAPTTLWLLATALAMAGTSAVSAPSIPGRPDPARPATRVLSTGRIAIRVPEGRIRCIPPRTGRDIPGPILGLRGPDGQWRGAGWIEGSTPVVEIRGEPEGSEYVVTYAFAGGGVAEVRLWAPSGTDHIRIAEECRGCTSTWVLSFEKNFRADRVLAKPTEADGWTGVRRISKWGHRRHGRIAFWSQLGRLLDLNDWIGVYGGMAKSDFVGFIRVHPDSWSRPARNYLSLWERNGQLRLEGNWRTGKREWLLVVTSRKSEDADDARRHMRAIERHWVWARHRWVLDWDEPLEQFRPEIGTSARQDKRLVLEQLDRLTSRLAERGYIAPPETRRYIPVYQIYDRLRRSGALNPTEDRRARRALAALAYNCFRKELFPWDRMGLPPDHPENPRALLRGLASPTFNAERIAIVGELGLILRRHPMSRIWIEHFIEQFAQLLDRSVYPGGCWEEGFSGAYEALLFLTPAAIRLHRAGLRNFLADERFRSMWEFFVRTATPPEADRAELRSVPAIGEVAPADRVRDLLLLGARAFEDEDPRFAGRLLWLHREMGGDGRADPGRLINALVPQGWPAGARGVLLGPPRAIVPSPAEPESADLPGFGAVLRAKDGSGDETCLILRNGRAWGRSHNDDGSIHLYAKGAALVVDAGCAGSGPWQRPARGHSRVAFPHFEPANFLDGPQHGFARANRGLVKHLVSFSVADYLCGQVPTRGRLLRDPHAPYSRQPTIEYFDRPVFQNRHILFLKPDYFVLFDEIEGDQAHEFWLHVECDRVTTSAHRATFSHPRGVALDVFFLDPRAPRMRTGDVRTSSGKTTFIAIEGADNAYRVVLFPRKAGERRPSVRRIGSGVVKVQYGAGWNVIVMDNALHRYRDLFARISFEASIATVGRHSGAWTAALFAGKSLSLPGLTIEPTLPVSVVRDRSGKLTFEIPDHKQPATVRLKGRWLSGRRTRMGKRTGPRLDSNWVELQIPPGLNRFTIE